MWVVISMITVWLSPNIYQFMQNFDPTFKQPFKSIMGEPSKKYGLTNNILNWSPSKFWAISVSLILVIAIMAITSIEEFIYFKF